MSDWCWFRRSHASGRIGPSGQDRNLGSPTCNPQHFLPVLPPKPSHMCPPGLAQPSPPPARPQRVLLTCTHLGTTGICFLCWGLGHL